MLAGEKSVSDVFNFLSCKRGAWGNVETEIKVQLEIQSGPSVFSYEIAALVRMGEKAPRVRDGSVEQFPFQSKDDPVVEFQLETRNSAIAVAGDRKGEDSASF